MNVTTQAELDAAPRGVFHYYIGEGALDVRRGQCVRLVNGMAYVEDGGWVKVYGGARAIMNDGAWAFVYESGVVYVRKGGCAYVRDGGIAYVYENGEWVRKDGPCTIEGVLAVAE